MTSDFFKKTYFVIKSILNYFLFLLPAVIAFVTLRIISNYPELVEEVFSRRIYRVISTPVAVIVSIFPFSLTEISLYLSVPLLFIIIYKSVKKIRCNKKKSVAAKKIIRTAGWFLSFAYLIFMFLMGFNYARLPLSYSMEINVRESSVDELEEVCYILLEKMNEARENVLEDDDGVMKLRKGIRNSLDTGYKGFHEVREEHFFLDIPRIRAKGVLSSGIWSYTGITGMFFPFFVEANVNIDVVEAYIPSTVLHELAHTIGIAREDEAEFISFITGINHPDPDFVYSAYLSAYRHASSALFREDRDRHAELSAKRSEGVRRDMTANRNYWRQFEGPVRDTSTAINHAYLQSNLQEDGVKSYGRVVDLIIGYYRDRAD